MPAQEPAVFNVRKEGRTVYRVATLGAEQVLFSEVDEAPTEAFTVGWPAHVNDLRSVLSEVFQLVNDYGALNPDPAFTGRIEIEWRLGAHDHVFSEMLRVPTPDALLHAVVATYTSPTDHLSHLLIRYTGSPTLPTGDVAVDLQLPSRGRTASHSFNFMCLSGHRLLHRAATRLITRSHANRDIATNGEYMARILADDPSTFLEPLGAVAPIPVLP